MKSRKFMRTAALLLASVMSVLFISACKGDEGGNDKTDPDNTTATPADQEVAIRIAWWGNQLRNDTTTAMLDAFVADNPNVKYEAEFTDWNGYWDKLSTQAASNNLPDIIQQDYAYIAQYHAKNQLANLSEQVDAGNLNIDDVPESILATGMFDGKLYALCAGVNAVGMLYNTRLAEEAGIEVPLRITYDEIMEMSAKVFEKTGVRGDTPGGNGSITMMARDVGEQFFDVDNHKIGASEATVLKYFKQIEATITSEWAVTVDTRQEVLGAGLENETLPTLKSWNGFPGGSNMLAAYEAPMEDKLAMVMYPTVDDASKESMYLRPSQFFSVTQTSKHKDVSARVIDYFTNEEKAQDILKAERGVPVSTVMADYLSPQLDDVQQRIFAYISEVGKVAVPFDPPMPNGANEVNKLLDDLTDMIRYGELTPEAATERFIPEANAILEKAAE